METKHNTAELLATEPDSKARQPDKHDGRETSELHSTGLDDEMFNIAHTIGLVLGVVISPLIFLAGLAAFLSGSKEAGVIIMLFGSYGSYKRGKTLYRKWKIKRWEKKNAKSTIES